MIFWDGGPVPREQLIEPGCWMSLCHAVDDICEVGVTARAVKNCPLSGAGHERSANIAQRPKACVEIGGVPDIIPGQGDMLPAERCHVGQEIVGNDRALGTQKRTHPASTAG